MGDRAEALWEHNSKLVIVKFQAGSKQVMGHKPGFGSLVEAMSGFASMNGFDDRPPVLPPLALADMIAGLYGAFSIMVAVREIEQKKGAGQIIDLSLFEPILSVLGANCSNPFYFRSNTKKDGELIRNNFTAERV